MIHKRHMTSIAVAIATVLLMAGPAMAVGKFQPLGQYHGPSAATHGSSVEVAAYGASSPSQTATLCSEVCDSTRAGSYWPDTPPGGVPHTPKSGPTVLHVSGASNTFDWGDAAIGAGAAILVMALIAGGLLVTSHRPRAGLAKTG